MIRGLEDEKLDGWLAEASEAAVMKSSRSQKDLSAVTSRAYGEQEYQPHRGLHP